MTPTSIAFRSSPPPGGGTVAGPQMPHGHVLTGTLTLMPAPTGVSMFPLSSVARLLISTVPGGPWRPHVRPVRAAGRAMPRRAAVYRNLDASDNAAAEVRRRAADDDVVSLLATSIRPTGETIVELGAAESADAVAAISADCSVAGCAPMSANRFTVACCIARSGTCAAGEPRSCSESRPHAHCTVPAPNTSAPLAWRYSVRCVRRGADADGGTVVDDLLHTRDRRRRKVHEAGRARAVVQVFVPLIAQGFGGQRREAGCQRRDSRVPPEPQVLHRGRHADRGWFPS